MERMAFSLTEVAETLGISPRSVINLIESGALKAVRVGGLWRVAKVELDRFLQEGTPPPPGQARRGFKRGVKHGRIAKTAGLPGMELSVAQTARHEGIPADAGKLDGQRRKAAERQARHRAKVKAARVEALRAESELEGEPTLENSEAMDSTRDAPRADKLQNEGNMGCRQN